MPNSCSGSTPNLGGYPRTSAQRDYILPPQQERDKGKKTLILDLDETLVHSTFQPTDLVDLVIPVHFY